MLPIHLAGECCSKMWIRGSIFSLCLVEEYTKRQDWLELSKPHAVQICHKTAREISRPACFVPATENGINKTPLVSSCFDQSSSV